jgi:hypothetical protein
MIVTTIGGKQGNVWVFATDDSEVSVQHCLAFFTLLDKNKPSVQKSIIGFEYL